MGQGGVELVMGMVWVDMDCMCDVINHADSSQNFFQLYIFLFFFFFWC